MILKTVAFKRTKDSPQEVGIEIEDNIIIDRNQRIVPSPIHNAIDIVGIQLDLKPLLDELSKRNYKKL